MNLKGALAYIALGLLGLAAAYFTWQRPIAARDENSFTLLDTTLPKLDRVHIRAGSRWVDLHRDQSRTTFWVSYSDEPVSVDGGTAPESAVRKSSTDTLASTQAMTFAEQLAPLSATRSLGQLSKEKLKELHLDDDQHLMEITSAGKTYSYRYNAGEGAMTSGYLFDVISGNTYVVPRALTQNLSMPLTQWVDHALHRFSQQDYDRFEVHVGEQHRTFIQGTPPTFNVSPQEAPEKGDEFAHNWNQKVFNQLIVVDVLSKDEQPPSGALKPAVRVDYSSHDKLKGYIEFSEPNGATIYARSENTTGWVALHGGTELLIDEARRLVGNH